MAEKHKSKYKAPKDLEKSQKPKPRKDLKDYTEDDKNGKMNPKSTGDKQLNVLRKTDKAVQDDGKLYPTYNADERLYKDLEDAEYDPKTAAKRMEKREKEEEKTIKDKIDNLTVEQREHLIREYIRRKIQQVLREQTETPEEETPTELPAEEAPIEPAPTETPPADAADPNAAPTTDASVDMSAPAGGADLAAAGAGAAVAATGAASPDAAATPPAAAGSTEQEPGPEERQTLSVSKIKDVLSAERSNLSRIETLFKGIDQTFKDADPIDIKNFYRLMLRTIAKKYKKLDQPEDK